MDNNIVLEKFASWTQGLNPEKARIALFNRIRDIPYYLVPQVDDPCEWGASILRTDKGSCSPKHYLLGFLFSKLNIPVRYATYPFKWDMQPIKYTDELKSLAQGSPVGYHVACQAYIDNRWILVDATWDSALRRGGFLVNDNWDGRKETQNAVLPLQEVIHESLQERLDYVREKKKLFSESEKATYAKFIEQFNLWLEGIRKGQI